MKWKHVLDELPRDGQTVLIAVRPTNKEGDYTILMAKASMIDREIIFKDKWGFCQAFKSKTDYWMSLPEKPELISRI